jgi:hypothetical protein
MGRSRAQKRIAWPTAQAVSAAAVTFLLLTGAAHAEQKGLWRQEQYYHPDRKEKQRKIDEAYQKTIKNHPVQPATNDPWGSARAVETTQGKGGSKTR